MLNVNMGNVMLSLKEAKTALDLESRNINNTLEQEDSLEVMEDLVDSVIAMVNAY